jgi:sulfate permease, SulP family
MMVAIGTFEWSSFTIINKMPKQDIFVGVVVAIITILLHNLALAVLIGVIISALVFAWESAKRIRAKKYTDAKGVKHYELYGPLFFGSTVAFTEKFDVLQDPEEVIVDFKDSKICDMSAIDAVHKITLLYAAHNKMVSLQHLSPECKLLLQNAAAVIDVNILED